MTEWIDVVVYSALLVTLCGWLPARGPRFAALVIGDRNPEWAAAHRDVVQRAIGGDAFPLACRLWAGASVAILAGVQTGILPFAPTMPRWEALKDIASALVILGLVPLCAASAFFFRWLNATVPLADRRHASLAPRAIGDHVPRGWQAIVFAFVTLHLAAWLIAGILGRSGTPAFWGTLAFQFVISAIFLGIAVAAVRRKPHAIDRIAGPGYRRMEVRVAFALQLLPLGNGIARLYEQVNGAVLTDLNRVLHLAVVLVVLALAFRPRHIGPFIAARPVTRVE